MLHKENSSGIQQRLSRQIEGASSRFSMNQANRANQANQPMGGGPCPSSGDTADRETVRRSLISERDGLGLERILGNNDLLSTNYLVEGLRCSRAVCRIHVRLGSGMTEGYGTGFLISPNLIMTNHHVLPKADSHALYSLAEFDYEDDADFLPKATRVFTLDPKRFFYADETLDFAIVAVSPVDRRGGPLSDYPHLRLEPRSGKALSGERVSLIQHPGGATKRVALRNNRIVGLSGPFIHYETDTQKGSSGSPVFNDQWQVVALHHASVPARDEDGNVLRRDGGIWRQAMGEEVIRWIANEGVRVSAILDHLRRQAWDPTQARLVGELGIRASQVLPQEEGVSTISAAGLRTLMNHPDTTEAALRPYVVEDESLSDAFAPALVLRSEAGELGVEADLAVGVFNRFSRRHRRRRYNRRLAQGRTPLIKIVSEGDSWFQYPIVLDDVVDYLIDRPMFAVYSIGAAGDLLREMVARGEYLDAIAENQPEAFMLSGGGNDLVGRLTEFVRRFASDLAPSDYISPAFAGFRRELAHDFRCLFSQVAAEKPDLQTFCHSYAYVVPNKGRWLGRPLETLGIRDPMLQRQIMRELMDCMKMDIEGVAAEFKNVTFLDLRRAVSDDGWHDELHPNGHYCAQVGKRFEAAILSACRMTSEAGDERASRPGGQPTMNGISSRPTSERAGM